MRSHELEKELAVAKSTSEDSRDGNSGRGSGDWGGRHGDKEETTRGRCRGSIEKRTFPISTQDVY